MLARSFKDGLPPTPQLRGLISRALEVRRLAERAAVGASAKADDYSRGEQVYPWSKAKVEDADRNRRKGEDLLLSSQKADWDAAATALNTAQRDYDEAIRRSTAIRAALALRDRALAVLPGYTHWLADGDSDMWSEWAPGIEKLWDATHKLSEQLEKPSGDDVGRVDSAAELLSRDLKKLTQQFQKEISHADTERSQESWLAVTAALAVPFQDSGDLTGRTDLWGRFDNIRRHEWELTDSEKLEPADRADNEREQTARLVRRRAQIQGRLALATLGARWFDDPAVFKDQAQGDFVSIKQRVSLTPRSDSEPVAMWWEELAEAGESIGQRWLALIPEIDRLASEEKGISMYPEFQERLTKADRLGRQLDAQAPPVEGTEPTARLRETRVHGVLLAMTGRAWLDHWYAEDPKSEPYFHLAGSKFIADATKLVEHSPLLKNAQALLDRKGKLALKGPPSLVLTSERNTALVYNLKAEDDVLKDGYAVVMPAPDPNLKLEGAQSGFRAVSWNAGSDSVEFVVESPLIARFETDQSMNRPVVESARLKVEGTFRGQPLDVTTNIQAHPVPDTVAIGPPVPDPVDARVAIRGSKEIIARFGAGNGAIAIVLDCSGSMNEPELAPKYPQAVSALQQVLGQVPEGTTVSVWTFSQLPDKFRGPDGKPFWTQKLIEEAYQLKREPEQTIQQLRAPERWAKKQLDPLIRQLNDLYPYFETPLVHAMSQGAQADLTNAKGLRTLLVLTDGDDNRLEQDAAINPKKLTIPQFITERFKSLDVRINMVFFTPAAKPGEIEKARKNFAQALPQLNPPGSFVTADNIGELKEHLRRGIVQKLTCQILRKDGTSVSDEPLDVTAPNEMQKWSRPLPPSIYTLRVQANKPYEKDINLREGDRIIVDLVDGPDRGIGFQRALYADSPEFPIRERTDADDWKLAVLANKRQQQSDGNRLQIVSALERKDRDPTAPGSIAQIRPGFEWFRLDAPDVPDPQRRFSLRWHERIFYPGPVWHLDVPKWIPDVAAPNRLAQPWLTAWWSEPKPLTAGAFSLEPPGNTSKLPAPCTVEGNDVVKIESIGVEVHQIEVEPDKRVPESCLVVRLAFPRVASPYIVDPAGFTGVKVVGYEHRLYSQAGKYTGLFWKVNEDELAKLSSLKLLSLNALRDTAEKQKKRAEVKLPEPRGEDPIPDPVAPVPNPN
jgi:hypothetical protein